MFADPVFEVPSGLLFFFHDRFLAGDFGDFNIERWANQHFASETLGFYAILILLLAVRVFLHDRAALLRYLDVDDMARKNHRTNLLLINLFISDFFDYQVNGITEAYAHAVMVCVEYII